MIYNNSYFNDQLKKTFIHGKGGKIALAFCVVLISLVTLIVHNFFYTMRDTVVYDVFPYLTTYSNFAMLSIYNIVIVVFFVALYIVRYRRITIAEISTNKWYLMIKIGHSPCKLVFAKLTANILSATFIYCLCFVLLILLGLLMKLEMNINAIFSLAILGMVQLFFVCQLIMGISVFVTKRTNCLLLVVVGLVLMLVLCYTTGFGDVTTSLVNMEDTSYLFTRGTSIYIYVLLAIACFMLTLGAIKGRTMATSYRTKAHLGKSVYTIDYTNDNVKYVKNKNKSSFSMFRTITKISLVIVVVVSIITNVGIIMLATFSSPDSVSGDHIMMIFETHTMTGHIENNDFVWFERTALNATFEVGDVVLYYDNGAPIVQVVESINEDGSYQVDYMQYPHGVDEDSHSDNLFSEEISGVLQGKSGILGAFLIWNKTLFAKVLTTILPTLVLIFYDKIEKLFLLLKNSAGIDETDGDVTATHEV